MSRIQTLCVKESTERRTTDPHQLPIYATSSFKLNSVEEGIDIFKDPSKGHLYGRFSNPTVDTVAHKIATIEAFNTGVENSWGIMTSSGMSAISTLLLAELKMGDKLITQGNLYGGTTELIKNTLVRTGIEPILANLLDLNEVEDTLKNHPKVKVIYFETPSNPALDCIDIKAITALAQSYGAITIVDNTFSTPLIQQPFKYNVDYIIHSTTKYINGHGNSIAGIIIGKGKIKYNEVWTCMKLLGTNCNPWDAWLINNGIKTLPLRMERHSQNGLALAQYLDEHDRVASIKYLGLESHKHHKLASSQMNGFGGMLCFEVQGGFDAGVKFMNKVTIGTLAPTMGDIDTLIMHPASMSHLNVPRDIRLKNGITDGLIRVSVGLEDIEDLKEDFDRSLQ